MKGSDFAEGVTSDEEEGCPGEDAGDFPAFVVTGPLLGLFGEGLRRELTCIAKYEGPSRWQTRQPKQQALPCLERRSTSFHPLQ